MIQLNGYTTREITIRADVTRGAVSKWAKVHKWSVTQIGNTNIYDAQDVDSFFTARLRRKLMKAAGWTKAGKLIWSDAWDRDCPKCEGFAVEKPAKLGEAQSQEWLAGDVDLFCENCGLMPQERLGKGIMKTCKLCNKSFDAPYHYCEIIIKKGFAASSSLSAEADLWLYNQVAPNMGEAQHNAPLRFEVEGKIVWFACVPKEKSAQAYQMTEDGWIAPTATIPRFDFFILKGDK